MVNCEKKIKNASSLVKLCNSVCWSVDDKTMDMDFVTVNMLHDEGIPDGSAARDGLMNIHNVDSTRFIILKHECKQLKI